MPSGATGGLDLGLTAPRPSDAAQLEWFERTGHCGLCGNPGEYCTCTPANPCACRDHHDMGSARLVDALAAFEPVVAVSSEQLDMFGGPA